MLMAITGRKSQIGSGLFQDSTEILDANGEPVRRMGVFRGDPETLANRERISPLGVSRVTTAIGNAEIADDTDGWSVVHKFGRNAAVSTAYVPLTTGGLYRMPQAANATTLRVKAGNAGDTADGAGARAVTLQGLDETGALVEETLATAGETASATTSATFMRLFRAWVSASGAYPVAFPPASHTANIVIEKGAGSEDWLTIDVTKGSRAQSQVGCYTIPLGMTGYINSFFWSVDSNKAFDLALWKRENILESAAPYSAVRLSDEFIGLKTPMAIPFNIPLGPYPALTDLLWAATVASTTADVSIDFEILLKDT